MASAPPTAQVEVVKKKRGRPKKIPALSEEPKSAATSTTATTAKKGTRTTKTQKKAPAPARATVSKKQEADITRKKSSDLQESLTGKRCPAKKSILPTSSAATAKKVSEDKEEAPVIIQKETTGIPKGQVETDKLLENISSKKSSVPQVSDSFNSLPEQAIEAAQKDIISNITETAKHTPVEAEVLKETISDKPVSIPSSQPSVQDSAILSALLDDSSPATSHPPSVPPAQIPTMPQTTQPKSPASKLASSISQGRPILPKATSTTHSSPAVRNLDQIARIGAQRSMPPYKPRVVTGAGLGGGATGTQDIRQTKQYKSFARRWTSTIVALPILLYTSYALYERVFFDKQPRSLPAVNAFPPAEKSNQPSSTDRLI